MVAVVVINSFLVSQLESAILEGSHDIIDQAFKQEWVEHVTGLAIIKQGRRIDWNREAAQFAQEK